jgi:type II secretion system protein J
MKTRGFTLIEMVLALAASAITLAAVYGLFSKAVHMRNDATERTRTARIRAHAMSVIRNDLSHAIISGGTMAAVLEGSKQGEGSFPGYLKFMTTTMRDDGGEDTVPSNELQQVEYYIVRDPDSTDLRSGMLVRATDRNVLAQTREDPEEEQLLTGVESMDVEFLDGDSWQTTWKYSTDQTTLPQAVRVRIQPAAAASGETKPVPLEVLVPWTTQPAIVKKTETEP